MDEPFLNSIMNLRQFKMLIKTINKYQLNKMLLNNKIPLTFNNMEIRINILNNRIHIIINRILTNRTFNNNSYSISKLILR